jgi:hypothetical protein
MIPPPWQTVHHHLRRWQREGVWARVHHTLVMADRERAGREASPSAAIIDSQTVRTADQKGGSKAMVRGDRAPQDLPQGTAPRPHPALMDDRGASTPPEMPFSAEHSRAMRHATNGRYWNVVQAQRMAAARALGRRSFDLIACI